MKTFRQLYCERHGIAHEKFERALLGRCLHRHALLVYWLFCLNRDYRLMDIEFIRAVGDLRSRRTFHNELADYRYHPRNGGFLRKVLRLRVSGQRLQKLFERELGLSKSATPFPISSEA